MCVQCRREAEGHLLRHLRVNAMPNEHWPLPESLKMRILARVGDVGSHSRVPGSLAAAVVAAARPKVLVEVLRRSPLCAVHSVVNRGRFRVLSQRADSTRRVSKQYTIEPSCAMGSPADWLVAPG